jgi:transcriptional regulator with XRE-family HTH domain
MCWGKLLPSAKIPAFDAGRIAISCTSNSFEFSLFPSMSSSQFPNYLRANRKRLALSQDDVAFLLGTQSGTSVCRYERFVRDPSLETALACEAIFKRSVSELWSGLYQKAERDVAMRAKALVGRKHGRKLNAWAARRHDILTGLAGANRDKP